MTLPATLDQPAPASAVQPGVLPDEFDVWVDEEDIALGARVDASSCATVCAPASSISFNPRAPSSPIPVRITPIAFGPTFCAIDRNMTSTLGR